MNKILKNSLIFGGTGLVAAGAGAGIVTGVILPKALQAKDKLGSFVSEGGKAVDLKARYEEKGKLKVVAFGDSVTAGFNGYLADSLKEGVEPKEYYSYSDFLVHSLRESMGGKAKVEYKNFAQSGLKLADYKVLLESGDLNRQLKDADIIPITIGANDILSLLQLFRMPFWMGQNLIGNVEGILKSYSADPANGFTGWADKATVPTQGSDEQKAGVKTAIDNAKKVWESFDKFIKKGSVPVGNEVRENGEANVVFSSEDSKLMFENTVDDLIAIANGETGRYLNLDRDWTETIFDLIEREITTMIRDLHKAAPGAQIVIIGHALPFAQFPVDTLFEKNKNMHDRNLLSSFNMLLDKMKAGAKNSLGNNGFVDFYKGDELGDMKKYSWKLTDLDKSYELYEEYKKAKAAVEADTTKDQATKATEIKKLTDDFYKETIYDDPATEGYDYKYHRVSYESADIYASKDKGVVGLPVSNILDIHPTVLGHQLMGNALFEIYGKKIGLTDEQVAKGLEAGQSVEDNPSEENMFERWDEDKSIILGTGNSRFIKAKGFDTLLTQWSSIPDGVLDALKNTIMAVPTTKDPQADMGKLQEALKTFAMGLVKSLIKKMIPTLKTDAEVDAALASAKALIDPIIAGYILGTDKAKGEWTYTDKETGQTVTVNALSKLAAAYKMANGNINLPTGDDNEKARWSIYGVASFFALSKTLTTVLQDAQVKIGAALKPATPPTI